MKSDAGQRAIRDRDLCLKVVNDNDAFWRDSKAKYEDCRNRKFRLVPTGNAIEILRADYEAMVTGGMFFGEPPATFSEMIKDITALEAILNR